MEILATPAEFAAAWLNTPNWWFANTKYDDHISVTYQHLLDMAPFEPSGNSAKLFQAILIYDQLPRHVYRRETSEHIIQHFLQKAVQLSLLAITTNYPALTWTLAALPLRHTNDSQHIFKLMEYTWARLKATTYAGTGTDDQATYKRFLKATYERTPIHNQTQWIQTYIPNSMYSFTALSEKTILDTWSDHASVLHHIPTAPTLDSMSFSLGDCANSLISRHPTVIISLSGGVDSMVAMYNINKALKQHTKVIAVHIDYHNRPDTCPVEVSFLKTWCSFLGVPLYVRTIYEINRQDAKTFELRSTYETYTRDIRYNTYNTVWKNLGLSGPPIIIMGHNKDDAFENILTNMTHQCKYDSLEGMSAQTTIHMPNNTALTFLRPLLSIPKATIYAYASAHNIPYFHNSTPTWSVRGQIRNNIIPALELWNPKSISGLFAWAQTTTALYASLKSHVALVASMFDHVTHAALIPYNTIDTSPQFWKELYAQLAITSNRVPSSKSLEQWCIILNKFVSQQKWSVHHLRHLQKYVLNKECHIVYYKNDESHIKIQFTLVQ